MAELNTEHESHKLGMHTEQLSGRTQQVFFSPSADENFVYHDSIKVDFDKSTEIDAGPMEISELNTKIRDLMKKGYGTITVKNPGAKHSLGVGILNRLNLNFEGSLGYFGCGLADGPNIRISGRVGWSCAENMMSGTIVVEKNAGSTFGAAMRGGDLVCKGDVGSRTGIDQKGGTIIVGGNAGAFNGFMMQRGRQIICGDAGDGLGDSMYDGTLYVGGTVRSLGIDCVPGDWTDADTELIERKFKNYDLGTPPEFQKFVCGKQLHNYDSLEPSERKLVI